MSHLDRRRCRLSVPFMALVFRESDITFSR